MKLLILPLFSLLFFEVLGQNSKLGTTNPIPRQGDDIQIEFSVEKKDLTDLKNKQKKIKEDYNRIWNNSVGKGSFKINQIASDTGKLKIGPFSFNLNDTTYLTNTLTLRVLPKLPSNVRDGIWIRSTEIDNLGYLIVEQRVSKGPQAKSDPQGATIALNNDGIIFAELVKEKFEKLGLKIISTSSNSTSQVVDKVGNELLSQFVNYYQSTYTFEKLADFKGVLKIDQSLFMNFPQNGFIEILTLKN
ncbi:MAG TPA: BatD family protein [Cyclobacteriaceae bacterium]|nr:BatD family protein [Cyclobacteriaceae bacterium]